MVIEQEMLLLHTNSRAIMINFARSKITRPLSDHTTNADNKNDEEMFSIHYDIGTCQ